MTNLINENTALKQANYQNSRLDRKKEEKPVDVFEIFQKKKEADQNISILQNASFSKIEMNKKYGPKIEDLAVGNLNVIA